MFEKGQKVRVKTDVAVASEGIGGHVGTIKDSEPVVSEEASEGSMTYLVLFDHPDDEGWDHWLSDLWLNDYELEALDGSNS